jgi:hypothetical protein
LTVTNAGGSDSATVNLGVAAAPVCSLSCSASVPPTAELDEEVSFQAEIDADGCAGSPSFSWSFGDGSTGEGQSVVHSYPTTGTLRWQVGISLDGATCIDAGDITVSGAGPAACELVYWVPVVSRADGANGSVWRSDLGLLGADPSGAAVELRFHGAGAATSRVVTVAPGAMVNLTDVVAWLAPSFAGSGALEICSDGELIVDTRTYNTLPSDHSCFPGGTFGQHLGGSPSSAVIGTGETALVGQLRESSDFRTNLGVVNTGSETATVRIRLFDATGTELAAFELELQPAEWRQENRPFFRRASRSDLDAASASVEVLSGGGVIVYGSVIDNSTNDATTVPMR